MPEGIDYEILQILKSDGDMIEDSHARKVGGQLFSDKLGGIALPARSPTPTFVHKELNRSPIKRTSVHLETADPISPEKDSNFVLREAQAMWDSARQGLEVENSDAKREAATRWIALLGSGIAVIAACFYIFWQDKQDFTLELEKLRLNPITSQETIDAMPSEKALQSLPIVPPVQEPAQAVDALEQAPTLQP